jgi:hypothetical protein
MNNTMVSDSGIRMICTWMNNGIVADGGTITGAFACG